MAKSKLVCDIGVVFRSKIATKLLVLIFGSCGFDFALKVGLVKIEISNPRASK